MTYLKDIEKLLCLDIFILVSTTVEHLLMGWVGPNWALQENFKVSVSKTWPRPMLSNAHNHGTAPARENWEEKSEKKGMMRCSAHAIHPLRHHLRRGRAAAPSSPSGFRRVVTRRLYSRMAAGEEEEGMGEFLDYVEKLKNYERVGVPKGAGTDSDDGFDLGRMRRLLHRLGDPHLNFKAVHIAGTKGKGSTAAFLSTILREEGYSVGSYTSPHLLTIRERISLGRDGEPVSAAALRNLLHEFKDVLDQSIERENGALTHFEVFTAIAFALFSQEKVDIAVVEAGLGGARDATNVLTSTGLATAVITTIGEEHLAALGGSLESIAMAKAGIIKQGRPLVIGGPFKQHIENILCHQAYSMGSPVVSACDPGIKSFVKGFGKQDDRPYQSCDILVTIRKDLPLFIELSNVKLCMLGDHQLQNAATATCTALCLRNQGWKISDRSIHTGLEKTVLPGRSQFLTCKEIEALGLTGISVLIDGAHTEASAKSLADTIRKACANESVALVVAMATDKDHVAFSSQLLSGLQPDVVLLTEVSIAGSRSRMTSASLLKDSWVQAAVDLGIDFIDIGLISCEKMIDNMTTHPVKNKRPTIIGCEMGSVLNSMKAANQLIKSRLDNGNGLIVVTGSLHVVSSVLAAIHM